MNGDLAIPETLLNPLSGELIPTNDLPAVAEALLELRARRDNLNATIGLFGDAAAAQAAAIGKRTFHLGGLTLEIGADSDLEWDLTELVKLRDLGLPEERYNELVVATVAYKVNGNVARQIAGSNPAYAAQIEASKRRIPKRASATVKTHR